MDRETAMYCARVYLAEARRRRSQAFHATLLRWAANCRRDASLAVMQRELAL